MNTGSLGTFVISWSQTEIDGVHSAPLSLLNVGATWRYSGPVVRVDRPQDVLVLQGADGAADMRKRAARTVRRLVGAAIAGSMGAVDGAGDSVDAHSPDMPDQTFIVTDGFQSYNLTLIPVPDTGSKLLMMLGEMPPPDQDLWVVRAALDPTHSGAGAKVAGGVICFTPETLIATEYGPRAIAQLQAGDRIFDPR